MTALFLLALMLPITSAQDFQPLKVLLVHEDHQQFLPFKIQYALHEGIVFLQHAISVTPLQETVLNKEEIDQCFKEHQSPSASHGLASYVNDGGQERLAAISLSQPLAVQAANLVVFVMVNTIRCASDTDLLASAAPCYLKGKRRPAAARVTVCPQIGRWSDYLQAGTARDVFRHEMLHALGYGTIMSAAAEAVAPHDQTLLWRTGQRVQPFVRRFMDLAGPATEFVRAHFNCSSIAGVEAEESSKKHLSEYMFGNELMTPSISPSANYFTEISARILEATHLADKPWYSVNRSVIARETAAYSYGLGWGCTFALGSCVDYIDERIRNGKTTFPFCSATDYMERRPQLKVCTRTPTLQFPHPRRFSYACDHTSMGGEEAASGIQPQPLSTLFPSLLGTRIGMSMPSDAATRFCPFIQSISQEQHFVAPRYADMLPCF